MVGVFCVSSMLSLQVFFFNWVAILLSRYTFSTSSKTAIATGGSIHVAS